MTRRPVDRLWRQAGDIGHESFVTGEIRTHGGALARASELYLGDLERAHFLAGWESARWEDLKSRWRER